MESKPCPPAAVSGRHHEPVLHAAPQARRDEAAPGLPFPLAADCVGRPLPRIEPVRIARAFREEELERLIRERLDGPPVHLTIGEPINNSAPWLLMAGLCAMPFICGLVSWVAQ